MRIGKVGARFAMGTSAGQIVAGLMMLIHWILSWFVVSVVVLLRMDFGERYLSWINILFGISAVGLFTGFGNVILSQGQSHVSYTIEIAYSVVLIASVYHRVAIWRKNQRGEVYHSLNPGTSLIKLPWITEEAVAKWVEPAVLLMGSYIAGEMNDYPLKLWLLVSGIGLLVHEQISYFMQRSQFLDMRDAMIESRNWAAVIKGRPAQQCQGYHIAQSNLAILGDVKDFTHEEIQALVNKEVS